jgi:hypothetical protein
MCWFVTLAVPDSSLDALDRICAAYQRGLAFRRLQDTPTARVFPAGTTCVQVTAGGCSCGLFAEPGRDGAPSLDKERAKLEAKGWSGAKVERALQAKVDSASRPGPRLAAAADFIALVGTLVNETGKVHLHAHFHSGDQDTAEVAPVAVATLPLEEFLRAGFAPDTLVTLRR